MRTIIRPVLALIVAASLAAPELIGGAAARAKTVILICTSTTSPPRRLEITVDGQTLAVEDRDAATKDLYPLIGDAPQMIDRLVAEFSASGGYQCRREQPEP